MERITCLTLVLAASALLSACVPARQVPIVTERPLPTEFDLSRQPTLVRDWGDRVLADEAEISADTREVLVRSGERSLPLLRRFLMGRDEVLQVEALEIVRRIGPDAIPLLADVLEQGRVPVRRRAADALIDLAPETDSIQPRLRAALRDRDVRVVRDAVRALGALRERADPSVSALTAALRHADDHVRLYAAEALAAIGPKAARATEELTRALGDRVPGVRWAACEALGCIGPAAAPAAPQLVRALRDEFLYVRICAAAALGSIGPGAKAAAGPLREAAGDAALRAEAELALSRISGAESGSHVSSSASIPAGDARHTEGPELAGAAGGTRKAPARAGNPPLDWDTRTGRNIVWSVELGDVTFGRPVVCGDVVYVGSDNARRMNLACRDECGVLMAFRVADGGFVWQDAAPRVERGLREFLLPSTTSAANVDGDRLFYVTAECQLRCLDVRSFRDGVNTGPFQAERFTHTAAADIVWELDLCGLGVFPHEACNSEVLLIGDLVVVCTSNGQNEGHTRVPSPRAPSLIAVDRRTGEMVWSAIGPGEHVLHGQWCSPTAAEVNGHVQVLFGGGDGWLRAYDAATGREIWRFDGNPKDASWVPRPGVQSRGAIIASPVYDDGRVFIAMGEDPSHGDGPSLLHAVRPDGRGDVTESGRLWTCREIGRVVGTPVVEDGLLYVGDLGGTVCCVNAASGELIWKHETNAAIWGCLALAGGRLYVGNVDGEMTVLRAGRQKEVLARIEMDAPLYSRPAIVSDELYLATARRLSLIATSSRVE